VKCFHAFKDKIFSCQKGPVNVMKTRSMLGLLLALLLCAGAVSAQDQVTAPNYSEGDSWQFRVAEAGSTSTSTKALEGAYRVFIKEGSVRAVPAGPQDGRSRTGLTQVKRMLAFEEKEKTLQFPLLLNAKWTSDFEKESRSGVKQDVHAEMSVTGFDEVATSAGKFKAFKIERYETFRSGGRGKNSSGKASHNEAVYFYSPETRSIVKYHETEPDGGSHDIELLKFTPAK